MSSLRTLDVEVEELELGPGEALEVGLEVLAGQLVQRHDAEHRRLPHGRLHVVVRLKKKRTLCHDEGKGKLLQFLIKLANDGIPRLRATGIGSSRFHSEPSRINLEQWGY